MSKYDCKGCIYREDKTEVVCDGGETRMMCEHEDWFFDGYGENVCFGFTDEKKAKDICTYCKHYVDDKCNNEDCYKLDKFEEYEENPCDTCYKFDEEDGCCKASVCIYSEPKED